MKPHFEKSAVLGVGLIGASLSMALKKQGLTAHVTGFGRTEANLIKAKERSIIDSYQLDPGGACKEADLIVFATPVGLFTSIAERVTGSVKKDAVVIDVGSVKGRIVSEMERLFGSRFVGCHPIAGSERSGIGAADAELFGEALCVVTRTGGTDASVLDSVGRLWEALGSKVRVMSPEEHDRIFALISHLPHLVAYSLVNTVSDEDSECIEFAGRGFKDTTRIATSNPGMWRDICLYNRENILRFIDLFRGNVERLRLYLDKEDSASLEEEFKKARALRERIENRA